MPDKNDPNIKSSKEHVSRAWGPLQLQEGGVLGAVQHSTPGVSPRYSHGTQNQRMGVCPISVTENFAAQSPRHTFLSVIFLATQRQLWSWAHLDLNPGFRIIQFKLSYAQHPTTPTPYGPPTTNKCFLLMLHARGGQLGLCSILGPGGKQDLGEMEIPWPRRRGCDGATPWPRKASAQT